MTFEQDTIICGRAESVLAGFPAASVDMWLTSPPYDGLRAYDGYTFDFEAIAAELYRVTKPGGVGVWVVADETKNGSESGTSFRQALGFMGLGFKLHDTMIYESHKPPLTHNRYEQAFEYMFVFSKGIPKTFNGITEKSKQNGKIQGNSFRHDGANIKLMHSQEPTKEYRLRGNVWRYATGYGGSTNDTYAFDHPAMFPERLAEDHILSWSNPGDLILDPMCGSGTTCKMAIRHHRHFIGIDISPRYCDLARRRIGAVQTTLI